MNTRPLSQHEADNLARIHEAGLPCAPLFLTSTGLSKNILDATEPIRRLLCDANIHNFATQSQGQQNKVFLDAQLYDYGTDQKIRISAYRPQTKKGDPRIWPENFASTARPNEVWALVVHERQLHLLSLSHSFLAHELDVSMYVSAETKWLAPLIEQANAIAQELRNKLMVIASSGHVKAICKGPTAVGRTLEHCLGIPQNSSKHPDYKGIELKAGRAEIAGGEPRAQLFARVPNWELSRFKSVSEFLRACGYEREGGMHLRCTVSSMRENPQGLVIKVSDELLQECSRKHKHSAVLIWSLDCLEQALKQKHRETFWVKARSIRKNDGEYFELLSATHTRNPVAGQLARLLDTGGITVDHMISGDAGGGHAREKGPSFKLSRDRMTELFRGAPREYDLQGV